MIHADIIYKASIVLTENLFRFSGPIEFEKKIHAQRLAFGDHPRGWQPVVVVEGYDVLLNEFILKCQNNYKIPYNHEEICHCRMVPTEKILNAIKQSTFNLSELGRVTMAGTGCGSCKKDIDDLTKYLVK